MGKVRQRIRKVDEKSRRKKEREQTGSLKTQQVSPRVLARYNAAWEKFVAFAGQSSLATTSLVRSTAEYMEALYHEGEPYSTATDTLAAVQFFNPKVIGTLKEAWKLCAIWRRVEPPLRVLPFTPVIVLGLAGLAWVRGWRDLAALLLIGFDVFLRTGELFSLRKFHITFYEHKAVLRLISTKTSRQKAADEMVIVESQLARIALLASCRDLGQHQTVLRCTPSLARIRFKELLVYFDL